ncbi:hypothetical protein FA10DRAFT_284685 [Acaromyces ingoldii]|uniref:Uncharacterized protein n=1 Tax=Acaromyces ingoldii TaxID=215250 RepID=A0A316YQE1_9BASI|nr:hypothetical protein FA10DRAFT_284685 [Acaromyces ingoldii]PWN91760.1 hypothetical protein FA10DRAFT_284685 [Acaromyces ingoldii]
MSVAAAPPSRPPPPLPSSSSGSGSGAMAKARALPPMHNAPPRSPKRNNREALPTSSPTPTMRDSEGMSTSKSRELARAVAYQGHNQTLSQYRPNSTWSEGGASVVWSGDVAPPLPSPGLSTRSQGDTDVDEATSFADAQDRLSDDDGDVAAQQTRRKGTSGTQPRSNGSYSKAAKAKKKAASPSLFKNESRSTVLKGHHDDDELEEGYEGQQQDDEQRGGGGHGHGRNTSVGSSIWAGRGANKADRFDGADAPPMPMFPTRPRHTFDPMRGSMAETSSMYSEGPANLDDDRRSDFDDSPDDPAPNNGQPAGRSMGDLAALGDDDFEMMPTSPVGPSSPTPQLPPPPVSKRADGMTAHAKSEPRRLPDGTVVPKMPPIPTRTSAKGMTSSSSSSSTASATAPLHVTKRSKKGRLNRSPVLSYEEGAEEEERLVHALDSNNHAGRLTSSLGPRLKKNSPAPWELDDNDDADDGMGGLPRNSSSGTSRDFPWSALARPSTDRERTTSHETVPNPPSSTKPGGGGGWARQSMESLRGRSFHLKDKDHDPMPAPSPLSMGQKSNGTSSQIPDETDPVVAAAMAAAEQASNASRRSRSKSISSNAAGVLKGLGLASSAAPPTKKGNKFAKAFRIGGSNADQMSKKGPLSLSAGISSDDYAHLANMPPSPQPQPQQLPAVFVGGNNYSNNSNKMQPPSSPYSMTTSSPGALSHSSLARDGRESHENVSAPSSTSANQATPKNHRAHHTGGDAAERESGSMGSHNGSISNLTNGSTMSSSLGATASSAGTSPMVSPAKKPDLSELLVTSNQKYRDQAFTPKTKMAANGRSPSLGVGQSSPMQASSQGTSPAQATTPRMPSSLSYKRTSTFTPDSTYSYQQQQQQRAQATGEWTSPSSPPPAWKTMATLEHQQLSTSTHESQEGKSRASSSNAHTQSRPTPMALPSAKGQGLSVSSHEEEARAGSATPTAAVGMAAMVSANAQSSNHESDSSEAQERSSLSGVPITAGAGDMKQHPSLGNHGGVPYKLISLEQARLNQSRERMADAQRSVSTNSLDGGQRASNTNSGHGNSLEASHPPSSLKNKKSGFLKIFNKDNKAVDEDAAMPSMLLSSSAARETEHHSEGLGLVAPALQLRPMSSMFSGFGADLLAPKPDSNDTALDSIAEGGAQGNLELLSGPSNQLSAPSPAMTSRSVGEVSRTSSQAFYEDAQETVATVNEAQKVNGARPTLSDRVQAPAAIVATPYRKGKGQGVPSPSAQSPGFESAHSHATTDGSGDPGAAARVSESAPNARYLSSHPQQRPHSTASDQSDASSSALGLVNGFPATPNTGANAAAAFANAGERAAAISSTRNKAIELEAEMARVVAELAQLRQQAVEMGLVSQQPAPGLPSSSSKTSLNAASDQPTPLPSPNLSAPAPPSPLQTPIPQCSACGCNCAEQKRIQALNEAAILKGLSVLDRGRALKPSNGANPGKFGGYLNR